MEVMLALREARSQDSRCKRIAAHAVLILPYVCCTVVGAVFVAGLLVGSRLFYAITAVLIFSFVVVAISWIRWRKRALNNINANPSNVEEALGTCNTPSGRTLRNLYQRLLSLETAFKQLQPHLAANDAHLRRVQTQVVEIAQCQRRVKDWLLGTVSYSNQDVENTTQLVDDWTTEYDVINRTVVEPSSNSGAASEPSGASQEVFILKPPAYEEADKYGPPKYTEMDMSPPPMTSAASVQPHVTSASSLSPASSTSQSTSASSTVFSTSSSGTVTTTPTSSRSTAITSPVSVSSSSTDSSAEPPPPYETSSRNPST